MMADFTVWDRATLEQFAREATDKLVADRAAIDEAASKALLYAGKYSDIVQAITDPENQPSQYGTVTLAYHRAAIDELVVVLKESRRALDAANAWPDGGGAIVDTIWYTATETLFDFMDAAITKHTQRKERNEQA